MANPTLSKKQREELLEALKARFEKNMNRHPWLEWARVQAKLEANAQALWSLSEMEKTGGERMLSATTKRRTNTSSTTAPRKARKAAEAFATTVKRWIQGKKINPQVTPWIWQPPLASSF